MYILIDIDIYKDLFRKYKRSQEVNRELLCTITRLEHRCDYLSGRVQSLQQAPSTKLDDIFGGLFK